MKKFLTILLLLAISFPSSGCILGLAALIRWDRKNYEKQQKDKETQKEDKEAQKEDK